jgi:hypothetical protein
VAESPVLALPFLQHSRPYKQQHQVVRADVDVCACRCASILQLWAAEDQGGLSRLEEHVNTDDTAYARARCWHMASQLQATLSSVLTIR